MSNHAYESAAALRPSSNGPIPISTLCERFSLVPASADDSTVASFVGFLPARNPALAIAVIVNRPEGIFGGTVAAPVFREVALAAMQALNIAPDPNVVAAQAARNGAGGERDASQ